MLQLITPTGDRPQAWRLCQRWMQRQTYRGPVAWHIVDDGVQPMPWEFAREGWITERYYLPQEWGNTQARNVGYLLQQIDPALPVVIIEDDDYYAPDWLVRCARMLDQAELVGERLARYYNVATRYARQLNNTAHASLCATAIRGAAIPRLQAIVQAGDKFLDLQLWKQHGSKKLFDGHGVVGMKGLPGRPGIGIGHSAEFRGQHDPRGALLRAWIGADADAYRSDADQYRARREGG